MNIHGMQPHPQMVQPPQQMQQQMNQSVQMQNSMDNITKVKSLLPSLRESPAMTIKTAAQVIVQNANADNGGQMKGGNVDNNPPPRFEKHLEDFYSICDQIELNLKTAKICVSQTHSSTHYLPLMVAPTRLDPMPISEINTIGYTQYLDLVRTQITYAKEIHDTLICAAQNISPSE